MMCRDGLFWSGKGTLPVAAHETSFWGVASRPRGTPQQKEMKPLHAADRQILQRSSNRQASPGNSALYIVSRAGL